MEKLVIRTQLETKRLKLRLFNDQDLQIMFELNSDPEIDLPEIGYRFLKE